MAPNRTVDRFTHCPFARSDAKGGAAHLERMLTMRSWAEMVKEVLEAPAVAAEEGRRVDADVLGRAALAKQVADFHERALDGARELRDDVQRLITTLEREGIGAATRGNGFAAQARKISGALIRLETARETFRVNEGYRRAERAVATRPAAQPRLGTGEPESAPPNEPELGEEEPEDETED
jgi:hypothetical protein